MAPVPSSERDDLPDLSLKWGTKSYMDRKKTPKPPPEDSYSPEEQVKREKLRKKGVNPDLHAEMQAKVYGKGTAPDGTEGKGKLHGLWNKVAGTAMGGGVIK